MLNFFDKNRGGYDPNRPRVNNTTKRTAKQVFGHAKGNMYMQDTYIELLHDVEFIRNAFRNPRNLPKDLPLLSKLIELLIKKYANLPNAFYENIFQFHVNSLSEELKNMGIKFYRYYFSDKEKPVTIEAITKQAANHALEKIMPELNAKGYILENLVDVKVETPIAGVTTKKMGGKTFVWTTDGWCQEREQQ